jgi:cytochrome oxidase Cu insertion factor (SCO1/SenC/PrrC family)
VSKITDAKDKQFLIIISALGVIIIIIGASVILSQPIPIQFDDYGKAPNFNLKDENNNDVTLETYKDNGVLVISFIYTLCPDNEDHTPGECSIETAKMNTLLGKLLELGYNEFQFHLLSISFDWKNDNATTMKAYGQERASSNFKYWSFLSGNQTEVEKTTLAYGVNAGYSNETIPLAANKLIQKNEKITTINHNTTAGMYHSSVVWIIDNNRVKRMYHLGTDWLASEVVKEVEALIKM